MKVYVVMRVGLHSEYLFGVYSILELAKHMADRYKRDDIDDYHNWCVYGVGEINPLDMCRFKPKRDLIYTSKVKNIKMRRYRSE